ncbi:hypothetical protein [Candidatus Pantoea multigeneris]|uniref:Uncharacterized protein n=1 Tax=Candidatus Pantoea multigeneris TaxID=2608357 RepID=A0ABX0RFM8_9GAMM|nr:hypothetical protein [Pantoea multigeneris]NIF23458.1 hypothetical protein [Pantoea multigeneris]
MSLAKSCRNNAVALMLLVLSGLYSTQTYAITLNFSATLVNGSCDFELDRPHVVLGGMPIQESSILPGTLVAAERVNLNVSNCSGVDASLSPVIRVSGTGKTLGKWAFRSNTSTSENIGVMLVQTDTPPSYGSTALGNNDTVNLRTTGSTVPDQDVPFYVGAICGTPGTCAGLKAGTLAANIEFMLDFP